MKRVLLLLGVCLVVCDFSFPQDQTKSAPRPAAPTKAASGSASASASATNTTSEARGDAAESSSAGKLPVRRVVLYKNGVGYFEHLGRVRGSQDVHIDFTSAQLNDVLKSLTVLDLNGGRITGVDYNSEAPLARRLGTLRLALSERPSVSEFLGALRGARLEVRPATGPAVTGKLLSVERKTRNSANWTSETEEISLITDGGEVRTVDLNPSTSVRIVDHDLQMEVGKYLGLVASAREQDVRRMTISTAGTGERNLYVSYISEVPIWKTTYRIVLPSKPDKKPLLQGWAIIDNTVGEDWNDVDLSLVAGAPHSFIQQLSEPYYGRRPVVPLPESVALSPQTHGAALTGGNGSLSGTVNDPTGAVVAGTTVRLLDKNRTPIAQTVSDSEGHYSFSGLAAPENYHLEFASQGFNTTLMAANVGPGENSLNATLNVGSVAETVEVHAGTNTLETDSVEISPSGSNAGKLAVARRAHLGGNRGTSFSELPVNGRSFNSLAALSPGTINDSVSAMTAAANGQDLGDLFEYKLKDRVTLRKNQSALVPIAQTEIEAEKISLWSGMNGSGRPLRGLWLKNTSSLTLDGGSFSVLESEVFAGEGLTEPIKPGERRIVSYATDLGLLVEAVGNREPQRVQRVKISKGVMTQTSELRERTLYTVKNQDAGARTLIVEHPARPEWKLLAGTREPEERAPGTYRFRIDTPGKATSTLPVEESRTLDAVYQLSNLDDGQVALFLKQRTITPDVAQALQKITAQKAVVAKLEEEMETRQNDIDSIVDDQGRLRENMKALRGSSEEKSLLQRYTKQLDDQETQLDGLRKKIQDTEARRDKANDELREMIDSLQLEATL
ncbi:MAG TPA: carboxypeptidase regulatory-like domain-containing protein [Candidatus Acidoferrum sp.]|nr:carboxypeptidase regulatory-like domain-containing protein [Candidatus Acidoferrum sp.]